MIKYGLISQTDARTIEKTLDLIMNEFPKDEFICTTEIGIYNGHTSMGIHEYIESKNRGNWHTAIDNNKDKEVTIPFLQCRFIIGNSNEVYNQLKDETQHMIFVDGDHSYIGIISDFYAYTDKVKVGGYLLFHDTGKHIKPFKDFQHGDKDNPLAYISVRKALWDIGLLQGINIYWSLFFDEADKNNEAGGICVFKKVY